MQTGGKGRCLTAPQEPCTIMAGPSCGSVRPLPWPPVSPSTPGSAPCVFGQRRVCQTAHGVEAGWWSPITTHRMPDTLSCVQNPTHPPPG
jgi:hypothetical protein